MSAIPLYHIRQFGTGADLYVNDCAAACGCMLALRYLNISIDPDAFYKRTRADWRGLRLTTHVKSVLAELGLPTTYKFFADENYMRGLLASSRPFITQVLNGSIWHAVVVTGMDDTYAWVHDPLRTSGPSRWMKWQLIERQGWWKVVLVPLGPVPRLSEHNTPENVMRIEKEHPGSPPPGNKVVTYTVEKGDTLYKIGVNHGTTWQELARINELKNPNAIQVGQRLRVK